jgi:hypothetical protein
MKPRVSSLLFALVALIAAAGCNSHADNVCQDIGDCSQGGSSDWIASCQAEAKDLENDSVSSATCGAELDTYFSCADSNYTCHGATALFPGCADHLTALDACLASATANTSCVRLEMAEVSCTAAPPDATGAGTPPACTAARDCQAACYLKNVADVCAPRIDEIQSVTTCASTCPF